MSIIQGTSKAAGGGYEIDQSIRFNDDDSAYLSRTPGSAGNRKTFTFSCWVKRANLTGANQPIFSAGGDDWLMFLSAETLGFNTSGSNYRVVTTQLFRDPGAWMHIVLRVDTTNATAGDRLRLYVNGSEITDFGTDTNPTLNFDTAFNSTGEHNIGKLVGASQYFDGYLAEIHHVDGTSLGPDSFGEANSDGVWIPKKPSGLSYGTTGFHVNGADSSDLGADQVGSNDWTSNNLATTDQMPDTPSLNHWTLNPLDSGSTLANGNLQNKGGSSTNTHAPAFPKTGKWYVEIDCIDINTGTAGAHFFGICDASVPYSANFTTHAATSAGQQRGGQLKKDNSNTSSGTAVNDGDVIALAFDADNLTLDLYVNNSASGSQITGLTDVQYKLWIQDGGTVTNMQFNFAEASFEYTPPTGFKALSTANLVTPSITDGSAYFNPVLFTGNSGTAFSVTGVGFQPDFVWGKPRSYADNHRLMDVVRGSTKQLISNATNAEFTQAQGITSFDSDGFTVGTHNGLNTGTNTYVGWCWLADNTTGSSNTDGSINTTATSVNTTAGFSISKYDGSGSNATVGHGLGIAPKMVIVKEMTDSRSWVVYHEGIGDAAKVFYLNQTAAAGTDATVWNSTAPTSTVFSVGTANGSNGSGNTYIAYAFAEIPGYSSIGSYTGNGSATDGPFVYTGFKPAFVMFKVSSNAPTGWAIIDNKRSNPFNPTDGLLQPDQSGAEGTTDKWDILSNGFKVRTTWPAVNGNGYTVTYMAFAEHPFGGDGVAPATAR